MNRFLFLCLTHIIFGFMSCRKENVNCSNKALECQQYCVALNRQYANKWKQDLQECDSLTQINLFNIEEYRRCTANANRRYQESLAEIEQCHEDCNTDHQDCIH